MWYRYFKWTATYHCSNWKAPLLVFPSRWCWQGDRLEPSVYLWDGASSKCLIASTRHVNASQSMFSDRDHLNNCNWSIPVRQKNPCLWGQIATRKTRFSLPYVTSVLVYEWRRKLVLVLFRSRTRITKKTGVAAVLLAFFQKPISKPKQRHMYFYGGTFCLTNALIYSQEEEDQPDARALLLWCMFTWSL